MCLYLRCLKFFQLQSSPSFITSIYNEVHYHLRHESPVCASSGILKFHVFVLASFLQLGFDKHLHLQEEFTFDMMNSNFSAPAPFRNFLVTSVPSSINSILQVYRNLTGIPRVPASILAACVKGASTLLPPFSFSIIKIPYIFIIIKH